MVFPFEDWQFCCPSESRVDIWTHGIMGAELHDSVQADVSRISVEADIPEWALAQQNLGTTFCVSDLKDELPCRSKSGNWLPVDQMGQTIPGWGLSIIPPVEAS
ncbi:hypothetical protein KBZ18_16070 [Synechococcus sp. Cruz-9H2]|uniref:hypothetical protein n=1 Tax=unclassified Synechococcus TaxID=2626047 RepID=UPI0037DA7206|nr:hypothetical protein [Synechococcus sp. Cruz-9H2]MCP9845241.1 hypothetical protein [Synechococcus sp. Edmonson 11F2]MCP9857412.1 hypothetical protein [Synechococcus sp. Cruz-9C9]MCP9864648.1 hypothetical protein [Synechococcus sp. Cruz-7E5]MCP9871918.1 hypothetical protein [Synechococcus sp. Cruz-7B9]